MEKRKWLIKERESKHKSQEQLAEECNVTQMAISNIENGYRRPSPELAKKIAKALDFEWTKFYEN